MTRRTPSKRGRSRNSSASAGRNGLPTGAAIPANKQPSFSELQQFFNLVRRGRQRILSEVKSPLQFCEALLGRDTASLSTAKLSGMLAGPSDLRDYQIASTYALLIGKDRRKELSAYFTPPALTGAVLQAAAPFLKDREAPRILDPACGGGAFLVPLARALVRGELGGRVSAEVACKRVIRRLQGVEIDAGLAALSRRLLGLMLSQEFSVALGREARAAIRQHDFLTAKFDEKFDLVVANPPYGRVRSRLGAETLEAAGLANNGGHTNFYSLFLMRALGWVKPGGGLVFVLPTSFVAGPYFAGLRQEILDRADVVSLDLHEQRENLFVGAIQDVCLLTLRRHRTTIGRTHHCYDVGLVDSNGAHKSIGSAETPTNGEPWMLPVAGKRAIVVPKRLAPAAERCFTIADYGYRIRVGKVVPTRERDYLHTTRCKGAVPLLWASCVRPDGSFSLTGSERFSNPRWYAAPGDQTDYVTKGPCVLVQRTSNRDQHRRLNAAAVPSEFLDRHKRRGFIAENHVIVIEATIAKPGVAPAVLSALLNSPAVNERFSTISGTFSVSAKLLARLALPDPAHLPAEVTRAFSRTVREAFAAIDGVLAPSDGARHAQDAVDQAGNLAGRAAVDKDARLKRQRLARS